MRVGLNLLYLIPGVVGGTETYARGLVNALAAVDGDTEFLIYVNRSAAQWPLPAGPNLRRIVCEVDGRDRMRRYAFEQLVLPGRVRRDRLDVLHSLGYTTPALARCASVVTVHDLNFRSVRMPLHRRLALELFVRLGVKRSQRVIADSEFTRREIVRVLGGRPERIRVVYAAADEPQPVDTVTSRSRGPYILAFASGFAHKNMRGLLEAYALAKESGLQHRLLIVGRLGAGESTARAGKYADQVDVAGYLAADELEAVFRGATLLVFPSRYEGFGLPVLEAMHRGVPVVCSNRASLPEVAGDAAVYFDPDDSEAMARAIARVAQDPELAADLVDRGRVQARLFDWNRAAQTMTEIYAEVLQERSGFNASN